MRRSVAEFVGTFTLIFIGGGAGIVSGQDIVAVALANGLAIGLSISIDVFVGGPVTGAAMNPARAFGPMLAGGEWDNWWVYWVAPIAGALVAGLGYEYLYLRPLRPPVVGPPDSGVEEPRPGETAAS